MGGVWNFPSQVSTAVCDNVKEGRRMQDEGCQRKQDPVSLCDRRGVYGNPDGPGTGARAGHCHRVSENTVAADTESCQETIRLTL
ncbi:hypothetical protein NQZ68_032496 [Dissostichus eleginoides]|nr:hypothetical protein NQZ68_032496 [Dissostichus eleginoides]